MNAAQVLALEVARMLRDWPGDGMLIHIGDEYDLPDGEIEAANRTLMGNLYRAAGVRACRQCGCTEEEGCEIDGAAEGPTSCSWVEDDLCSACQEKPLVVVAR